MSWEWLGDGGKWTTYSEEDSETLETAHRRGQSVVKLNDQYKVQLKGDGSMQQFRIDDTSRRRDVRRIGPKRDIPAAAAAAAAGDQPAKKKQKDGGGGGSGTPMNAVRLQKDFATTKADPETKGWSVELVNDDLQHWEVKLYEFDRDSQLYKDLQRYKKSHGIDCLTFWLKFPDAYPVEPPFAMVRKPRIQGSAIFNGGFCIDVLMQNWSPAIRPESLLLQIRQLLMEGNARIQGPGEFAEKEARSGFEMARSAHKNDPNFSK
jgi:ubiquitin-protein ligase